MPIHFSVRRLFMTVHTMSLNNEFERILESELDYAIVFLLRPYLTYNFMRFH